MWEKVKAYLKKNKKHFIAAFISGLIAYIIFSTLWAPYLNEKIEEITYPEFMELVADKKVDAIYYNNSSEYMTVALYNEETSSMPLEMRKEYKYEAKDERIVPYPSSSNFREEMLLNDIRMEIVSKSSFLDLALNIVSLIIPLYFLFAMLSFLRMQTKGLDKKNLIQTSEKKFDDIIGHEEILEDVKFITDLIKDPTIGDKVKAKLPKGLLLEGPPGCGKTLIAKAMAGEANVPFLYQNASNFIELYVGMGAKRVRELFAVAKKVAPCILFIDEIDAVGKTRDDSKNTSENDQTINQLLTEMDGFTGREGVFIIAATNRADGLDPALLRSGRFDRRIIVNPPKDWMVRKELFEHYLSKYECSDDIDLENLSKQTSGFTGADIEVVCNEASIRAVMKNLDAVNAACIEEAIDVKVFKGDRSKKKAMAEDRRIVAYHESGHAVMSYLLKEPIARASIQSTVSGVGGAVFHADKETIFRTKQDYENRIKIAYAGRASEEIKFHDVTTGASSDITNATQLLIEYIETLGFDKDFGLLDIKELNKNHLMESEAMTQRMSSYSSKWYRETVELLEKNYDKVEALATKLLEVETLSGDAIYELFAAH